MMALNPPSCIWPNKKGVPQDFMMWGNQRVQESLAKLTGCCAKIRWLAETVDF